MANTSQDNTPNLNPKSGSNILPNTVMYISTVIEVYPINNTLLLNASGAAGGSCLGLYIPGIMSNIVGVSINSYPQIGQKVLVLKNTNTNIGMDYIIGCVPDDAMTSDYMFSTNHVGLDSSLGYNAARAQKRAETAAKGKSVNTGAYPVDMVDGELSIKSPYGPGVDFLNNLVRLKASDLSKIECFVIDDFIRILSQNFEHISAFGDYNIINNNGMLDVIWKGSCYEHETFGKDSPNETKGIDAKGDIIKTQPIDDTVKTFYDDGKWRFQQYIGKLGGFIHTFITEPGKMLDTQQDSATTGRGHFHWNSDGSFILQSLGDIVLEKVVRIPVPVMNVKPEELDYTEAKLDAYAQWVPPDSDKLYETSYMLKDYGRWLSNYYSLAAFHAFPQDITVPSEADTPTPTFNVGDAQLKSQYAKIAEIFPNYITRYATIRIFRDGSILTLDGYGSSIHQTAGDINISTARDFNVTAAGAINLVGRDVNIVAADEVDITAAARGILLKAGSWLQALCMRGALLLQSNMDRNDTEEFKTALGETDDDAKERFDNANGNGIILKTTQSNVLLDSGYNGIIMQCSQYLNKAYSMFCKCRNFVIDKIANFGLGETQITSANVYLNSLYANQISNRTAIKTVMGNQYGLTQKHDENKLDKETTDITTQLNDLVTGDNQQFKDAAESDSAEDLLFRYRQLSTLTPNYSTIYRPIAQAQIADEMLNPEGDVPYSDSAISYISIPGYGNNTVGYPAYPGDRFTRMKIYNSRLGTKINEPTTKEGSALAPNLLQGTFSSSAIPSQYIYKPDKYNE